MSNMSLKEVKALPPAILLRFINQAKKHLKNDDTMKEIFAKYDEDIDIIDYIPTMFGNLDVSAKTNHGVVILSYKLLTSNFKDNYSYLVHEYQHWADQCLGTKPTASSEGDNYLDNKHEEKAFQQQVKYIADVDGDDEAEEYVDNLLEYHEVDEDDVKDKKDTLMSEVD